MNRRSLSVWQARFALPCRSVPIPVGCTWTSHAHLHFRAVVATGFLLVTCPAWAQDSGRQASTEFARLQQKLKTGDSVIVRIENGTEIKGRLQDVDGAHIAVLTKDVRREIPADQVTRVQRRRNGILLGALIGAGVGIPFGIFLREYAYNEGGNQAGALALPIAVGLGVGIGIDALLVVPRTVYERKPGMRSGISLVVGPRSTAARVTFTF